ncbi:MAG: hypothetical protein H0X58_08035, partial [Acidimicrobiia bacterium]|nr:hypothetical protein [Acidimicrobiia bacterium]
MIGYVLSGAFRFFEEVRMTRMTWLAVVLAMLASACGSDESAAPAILVRLQRPATQQHRCRPTGPTGLCSPLRMPSPAATTRRGSARRWLHSKKEGLDFSPDGLEENIPDSCAGLDIDAITAILGVDVIAEDASYGFVRFEPGYLSCNLKSQQSTDVSLAIVHLAPDLNGWNNWATVGTLDGAQPIDGLGDEVVWSDGSGGDNLTNKSMLQLLVTQTGTQSLIQAN